MPKVKYVEILDPRQESISENIEVNVSEGLANTVIGFRSYASWTNFVPFLKTIERLLRKKEAVAGFEWAIVTNRDTDLTEKSADEFASKIDVAIVGLGN